MRRLTIVTSRSAHNTALLGSYCVCALFFLFMSPIALAKDASQVILWPGSGTSVVRFTFGKFKEVGSLENQRTYVIDTTAENLSSKLIPNGRFSFYLFDKNKVRIGEGAMRLSNVAAGQTVKFQTTVDTSGIPISVTVVEASQIPRSVSITINSVPQGALLKVDGTEAGTTPKLISLGQGKHNLQFSKNGFSTGTFPLEIGPDDVSGGSVSYELGTSAFDSIELRDGTVLAGDLISISGMDVMIRVGGSVQRVDRNKIKRIMLTERDGPLPVAAQPATPNP
jgi:PEGA domain